MKNICVDCEKEINQNNSRCINCHRKILLEFANTIGKTEILKDYNNSRERLKMDSNHILLNIDSQLFKLEKLKEKYMNESDWCLLNEKINKMKKFQKDFIELWKNCFSDDEMVFGTENNSFDINEILKKNME